jgi:hypothetical protein
MSIKKVEDDIGKRVDSIMEKMSKRKTTFLIYISGGHICLAQKGSSKYESAGEDRKYPTTGRGIVGFYTRDVDKFALYEDIKYVSEQL